MTGQAAAERAYAYTKQRIITGDLAGGARLAEGQICDELELSRTPVHEAFLRLSAERLITLSSRQGATVNPVSPGEAADVLEMRGVLERSAVARVAARRPEAAAVEAALGVPLRRQEAALAAGDLGAYVEADCDFHAAVIALGGNPIAAHFFDLLRDRQLRLAHLVLSSSQVVLDASFREHHEMAVCLGRHDAAGYGAVLDLHLSRHQGLA
ncbi:GntR family transcriptional regulator [Glycomyces artemisiae]|uniref:DNA-binding GntR family transcriptional regulator n=1 Tax=Glycomyces artemisiae TaxID=1076443 RepID=A0A2T0UFY2_9ACTN|nr:GntR family transcriptional regulator [Glycomyces artemisiae]PRY56861.1 DNA-binding GntR family transcriptional regulator [Glycomyces artemisiae]